MTHGDDAQRRFRALHRAQATALLGYVLRRVAQPADAADVVADTFLVVWRRLDDVPVGPDERPYLYGVARRVLANQRRGLRRRDRLVERLRSQVEHAVADAPAAAAGADCDDVVAALSRLAPDDQELLRLTAWEGLAPGEIAVAMGIGPGTARSRLHRARRRLRHERAEDDATSLERWAAVGQVRAGEHPLAADHGDER